MAAKFSEDIIPLTDLKTNPGRVVRQVAEYEAAEEERQFMRAVVQGIADVEAGREVSIEEVRARLGIE